MSRFLIEEYLSMLPLLVEAYWANRQAMRGEPVSFGPHPQQALLLYEPPAGVERQETAIVFIHGGGWQSGAPALFRFMGDFFARRGFPTLLLGYRLAPSFKFPAQLDDIYAGCEAGILALRQRSVVPTRWVLGGQSAGAQLAALVAYADRMRCEALFGRLAGLFLISAPVDFSLCTTGDVARLLASFTGNEDNHRLADPMGYLTGGETLPVLLIHGDRDATVDPQNSLAFAAKVGAAARVYRAGGWHHSDLSKIFLRPHLPETAVLMAWLKTL
ncbi:MAG: alpha/beta hydrolase [Chloroflexota bacterium]